VLYSAVHHPPDYGFIPRAFAHFMHKNELPGHLLRELRRFFEDYKALEHKQVIVEDLLGPEEAVTIIRDALELYRRLRRGELAKA
jgi:inorganic pyrophosphatase